MEVGAPTPGDSGGERDLDPQQVDAVYALRKRFDEDKGEGGKPDSPDAPPNGGGGGKGKRKGGEGFQGGALAVP
eukprot:15433145-Alexandrium_andersonii.AAC.1